MGSHASRKQADHDATTTMVALRRIVRFLRLADRVAETASGLSAAQLFVLQGLAEAPATSLVEVARRTLTDPSSVSTVVDKLVMRKLVRRTRAADDARRFELSLTAAGMRIARKAAPPPQAAFTSNLRALPATKRKMISGALGELVNLLGAGAVEPRMFEKEVQVVR